jgi:hypothetical protein
MATSQQPITTTIHESWVNSFKEMEEGDKGFKSSRVMEAIHEWGSVDRVAVMAKPTGSTPLPDIIALLWEVVTQCMRSFGFQWADWHEPATLRQQLKGLAKMVCHERLWMTLVHSPAAKLVQQTVHSWFIQLEARRVIWGREHKKVVSATAKVDAAPEGILPAFLPVKDTLDRLQELSQLSEADLTAAGDPEPQTDLLERLQSVATLASKRTVMLANLKARKALAIEPGLDLPTLLISLIQPVGQTEDVWIWAYEEGEKLGQETESDNRVFLTSIAATLVAGLLQAVNRLTSFAAEQDRALLSIQLATNAKQRKLGKKTTHPEQTLPPREETETLAGSGMGNSAITNTGPQACVRKAKRARFASVTQHPGRGKEGGTWEQEDTEEEEMESTLPSEGVERDPGRGRSKRAKWRRNQGPSGSKNPEDLQEQFAAQGPWTQRATHPGRSGSESAYMQLSTLTPSVTGPQRQFLPHQPLPLQYPPVYPPIYHNPFGRQTGRPGRPGRSGFYSGRNMGHGGPARHQEGQDTQMWQTERRGSGPPQSTQGRRGRSDRRGRSSRTPGRG